MMTTFSDRFSDHTVAVDNVSLYFQLAARSLRSLVFMIHGHTQTSDMWAPLANVLADDGNSVIAVDMHGLGRSGVRDGGHSKKRIAQDFRKLVEIVGYNDTPIHIIGHDLGAFAAYAYAAQFARPRDTLTMMDATVPGIGIWPQLLQQPRTWHFGFYGPHAERIIEGRERHYLDRFWDEFSATRGVFTEEMRNFYTEFYLRPNGVRNAFSHFAAFEQDAHDNQTLSEKRLAIPVLGVGGAMSLGPVYDDHLKLLSDHSEAHIIDNAGHWLLEEQPDRVIEIVRTFLSRHAG